MRKKQPSESISSIAAENDKEVIEQYQCFEKNRKQIMEQFRDQYKRFQTGEKLSSKLQKTAFRSHARSSGHTRIRNEEVDKKKH